MKRIQFIFTFFFIVQVFSQRQEAIDFEVTMGFIEPNLETKTINGKVWITFSVLKEIDSIFLNAESFSIKELELNQKKVKYSYDDKKLVVKHQFKEGDFFGLYLEYECKPKQTVYFIGFDDSIPGNEQVWTQGQGKYTSHWLPSLNDMNDKIRYNINYILRNDFELISNGRIVKEDKLEKGDATFYNMHNPMSSYLAAFVIGDFDKKVIHSSSGVPIELYYEPKDSLKFEPTYRYTKKIFDFLEEEIGVPYPWQNYKQVPVQDFLYAGMENTTCTIFSNQYVIDSTAFVDKNYVNVNAHELAHQWFGNMVTEQSGEHHWLHEGFATYYAYLAEQQLFGDDYMYWKLYETAKTLHNLSENGDGEALTNPNANSLTFYEKGAWVLFLLREQLGDMPFKIGLQNYLDKYAYDNVTIDDFLRELEKTSNQSLTPYRARWLDNEEFPWEEVEEYLGKKNNSLRTYFTKFSSEIEYPNRLDILMESWDELESDELKIQLINDFAPSLLKKEFIGKLEHESVKVRQAFVLATRDIPEDLRVYFEDFLEDTSYITKEIAFVKLSLAFPARIPTYLRDLDGVIGLPNKNVRLAWLTIALVAEEIPPKAKSKYYSELNEYTSPQYNFEIRRLAFQYLSQIQALNDTSIKNLLAATNHHVWQFKKASRNLVRSLATSDKARFERILKSMPEEEQIRINKIITP